LINAFRPRAILFGTLIALTGTVILLPQFMNVLLTVHRIPMTLGSTFISGGFIGILFGLVNRLFLEDTSNVGSVYAFDIFGSAVGALTTCTVVLPVLGIQETAAFLTLMLCTALLALGFVRPLS